MGGRRNPGILLVLCGWLAACAAPQVKDHLSESERRADLAYLADAFATREQSFTPASRALFEARLADLDRQLGTLTHDQFIAGLQGAVAAADNGHTEALSHELQRLRLPLDLQWFDDGLFVVAARPDQADLLGARVVAIEGLAPNAWLALLEPYGPGTAAHSRILSGHFLERPELLAAVGPAASAQATSLTLAPADGGPTVTRRLPGRAGPSTAKASDAVRLTDRLDPLPLHQRDPGQAALLAWLPEIGAAYVRINRNDDPALTERLAGILSEIERQRPRHLIVDLRHNGGGNFLLTAPFAEALPAQLPPDGKLVLIIGPETFSAGIITAAILKDRAGAQAIVVGAPPGDSLTFWSEGGFLSLPSSGLRVHYSDGYHDWRDGTDLTDPRYGANPKNARRNAAHSAAAGSLDPDVPVPATFADYARGHDAAQAAVARLLGDGTP